MTDVSPLAPAAFPHLPPLAGVRLATGAAGVRYQGRTDLLLVELATGTTAAGVFTRSLCPAAPVDWCRKVLKGGKARALVVNSGNANAFTGKAGARASARTAAAAARVMGCKDQDVFVASTGIIGQLLDDTKIVGALPGLKAALAADAWEAAARAIMTTDTFPKGASRTAKIGTATVRLNGIVKGSGMIAPDMATMLGYVFTDAAIPAAALQTLLTRANETSFNSITVDSDTSTNDTVMLFATGQVKHTKIKSAADPALRDFRRALDEVMIDLAQQVVRDGEGATKFVTIEVKGAASDKAARKVGLAIANSPLVKTAIAGQDANWGRVVMAVGKAGQKADRDKLSIALGGVQVAKKGVVVPGYDETPVAAHMRGPSIDIAVALGIGKGRAVVWTCDLTHRYIEINADYRS